MRRTSIALLAVLLAGCTSKYQIRGVQPPLSCMDLDEFVRAPLRQIDTQARSVEDFCSFKMGIVEFSEAGFRHDTQYEQVLSMVEESLKKGGILITFVHGWHHSPQVCDSNLACFRRVLDGVASSPEARSRPIVGLYVGWRGEAITTPVLNLSTLWSRKAVAEDIGRKGGTQLLARLHELWSRKNEEGCETTMVTVGHSLGGAFLLSALKGSLTAEIEGVTFPDGRRQDPLRVVSTEAARDAAADRKAQRARFGDLVILVNPAIQSDVFGPFDQDLRDKRTSAKPEGPYTRKNAPEKRLSYAADQMPVMMVVASRADKAVRWLFPVGQWIAPWTNWHVFDKASASLGLGHFGPQVTHSLTYDGPRIEFDTDGCDCRAAGAAIVSVQGDVKLREIQQALTFAISEPPAYVRKDGVLSFEVTNRRLRHRDWDNASPYLVVETDSDVISGHNDIFNPIFTTFLTKYIASYTEIEHVIRNGSVVPVANEPK